MGRQDRWPRRPIVAMLLRAAILLVPIVLAVIAGLALARALPQAETTVELVAFLVLTLACTTLVLVAAERLMRRFGPLALLLRLGMVFPDAAPKRFRVAMLAVRPTRLARALDADGDEASPELALSLLVSLLAHDRLTRGHSERVAALTAMLADEMHLSDVERVRAEWGAMLHDVGKLEVPGRILRKPGGLDAEEWKTMRTHPEHGRRLVAPLRAWLGEGVTAVDGHHERWDGTGYPDGLAGEEIALSARVVAVTDAYETMTAARSYKEPLTHTGARRELTSCAGGQFDPAVVRAFLALSVPRLWLIAGPLAWLAQVPIVGAALRGTVVAPNLPGPAAGLVNAVGQTAVAAAVAGGAVVVGTTMGPGAVAQASPPEAVASPPAPEDSGADVDVARTFALDGLSSDVAESDVAGAAGIAGAEAGAAGVDDQDAAAAAASARSGPAAAPEAGAEPDESTSPGGSATAPGQTGTAPGQSGNNPGHGGTPPGHGGTPPGQTVTPPGQSTTPPGQSGNNPGHGGTPPGHGGTPPGQT